jgi:hypothetical protein
MHDWMSLSGRSRNKPKAPWFVGPRLTGRDPAEEDELKTLLRYAAQELTAKQRFAIKAYMYGWEDEEAGKMLGLTGRQGMYELRKRALQKMRMRLEELRIRQSSDVLSEIGS